MKNVKVIFSRIEVRGSLHKDLMDQLFTISDCIFIIIIIITIIIIVSDWTQLERF